MESREISEELRRIAASLSEPSARFESFRQAALALADSISEPDDLILRVAARMSRKKKPTPKKPAQRVKPSKTVKVDDFTKPVTEYSCSVDISLTADFEGMVEQSQLLRKLKAELIASLEAGVKSTARAYGLKPSALQVRPIRVDCAVADNSSMSDELE